MHKKRGIHRRGGAAEEKDLVYHGVQENTVEEMMPKAWRQVEMNREEVVLQGDGAAWARAQRQGTSWCLGEELTNSLPMSGHKI